MGRKRSSPLQLNMRLTALYKRRMKLGLKPPYPCPWCWKETCRVKVKNPFVFVYCPVCDKGELMPYSKFYKPIDYYCILVDSVHEKNRPMPIFRFHRMTRKKLTKLERFITIGKVEVQEVI